VCGTQGGDSDEEEQAPVTKPPPKSKAKAKTSAAAAFAMLAAEEEEDDSEPEQEAMEEEEQKPLLVAKVVSVASHPKADKLRVCEVECGQGAPVQVVCGAPNVAKDMLVIFAPVGSVVPSTGDRLQQAVRSRSNEKEKAVSASTEETAFQN